MRSNVCAALVAMMLAWGGGALAQATDPVVRSRLHFETGRGLYGLGDYGGAVREFAAGYDLSHNPRFLLNLGQAYRKLNQAEQALTMFKRFLAEAPLEDPNRAAAARIVDELEAERPTPPAAANSSSTIQTQVPSAQTEAKRVEPSPIARPWWRSTAVWAVVGGVVLAGAAVSIGVAIGTARSEAPPTLGIVVFGGP